MKQVSIDLSLSVKKTRKREFLEQMDKIVPWQALIDLIAPYYPKGKKGRPWPTEPEGSQKSLPNWAQ